MSRRSTTEGGTILVWSLVVGAACESFGGNAAVVPVAEAGTEAGPIVVDR